MHPFQEVTGDVHHQNERVNKQKSLKKKKKQEKGYTTQISEGYPLTAVEGSKDDSFAAGLERNHFRLEEK